MKYDMMTGLNNITGRVFPAWEQSVSSVGTGRSQRGNNMFSARDAKELQSCRHTLSILFEYAWSMARACLEYGKSMPRVWVEYGVMVILLLFVGVGEVWGQETDYSGFWYLRNLNNDNVYYLVPAADSQQTPPKDVYFDAYGDNPSGPYTMPFLTTYQTNKDANSIWLITAVENDDGYYHIKHCRTDKYVVYGIVTGFTDDDVRRKYVHLEENPTLDDNTKFKIEVNNTSYVVITPKKNADQSWNVAGTNANNYYGTGNNNQWWNGLVGGGTNIDNGSRWTLETAGPNVTFSANGEVSLSFPDATASIYYTTDGTTPNANSTLYSGSSFQPDENATCIKAIAIHDGISSGVTYVPVLPNSTCAYLIQGLGYQTAAYDGFFLQPGDVSGENTTVTTSSVARPLMQWYFETAGVVDNYQYFYIYNTGMDGTEKNYLFCNANGNVYMKSNTDFTASSDDYKFRLLADNQEGYRIVPKSRQTHWINKSKGHNTTDVINTYNNATDYSCRWYIIPVPDHKMPTALRPTPFTVSTTTSATYYKIGNANANATDFFIVSGDTYVTTSNTESDNNMAWYFKEAVSDDWLTYYHIVNAKTGKYMYFYGDETKTSNNNAFITKAISTTEKDRYQFVVAKTQTSGSDGKYYIVPKVLKDLTYNNYSLMRREGTNALKTEAQRADDNRKWTFTPTTLFCNNPEFTVTDGEIRISCVPDITKIYYTTDGTEPNPNDESQRYRNTKSWSVSNKLRIKVKAVVKNETTSASSAVYTLLNKPNVTLADGPYTYNGNAWAPSVTVSIGTTAPTEPATYAVNYENNTNAGTASVTVTDANENDNWYLWNIPTKTFTIDKASLTAKVNDVTVSYGDPIPTYTATYTGFVNGETDPDFAPEPTFSCDYTPTSSVGSSYEITISGGEAPNYKIATSTPGTLTVGQKSIGDGTNIASSLTLSFGPGGAIVLTDGETTLTENTDYVISGSTSASGKYSERTVSGKDGGNYKDSFTIKNANVTFTTDANESEWSATFVADPSGETADNTKGHAVPDGMRAFIITGIEEDWAIPEQLDYIPEGIPVLLVSDKATGGFIVKDASEHTEITTTGKGNQKDANMLEVQDNVLQNLQSRTIYLLRNNEFVLNNAGDLPAGKVYLNPNHPTPPATSGGGGDAPARLKIKWDEAVSGITELRNDGSTESQTGIGWYSIDGRRLNGKPSAKGLYIVDGKKVMVK